MMGDGKRAKLDHPGEGRTGTGTWHFGTKRDAIKPVVLGTQARRGQDMMHDEDDVRHV